MTTASIIIRILFVEDLVSDYELAKATIKRENIQFDSIRVETADDMLNALKEFKPHIVISDYSMPRFDGMKAIKLLLDFNPDIPLIILTGSINEEIAVECIKTGATDYVIKERMKRLPFAINEALTQAKARVSKRKAEKALIKSEERFRRLAENAQDIIFRYEFIPQGKYTYVSPSALNITGYTPDEYYANPGLFYEIVHPDDKKVIEKLGIITENLEKPITLRWIKKNGTLIWIEQQNVYMFNSNGQLYAIEGVARDISERVKVNEQLRDLQQMAQATLDSISANICVVNDKGIILSINKSWEEFAKRNNAEWNNVTVGSNYFEACENATEPDRDDALQFLWGIHLVLRGDKKYYEMEYTCHSPSEKRWFKGSVTPFELSSSSQKSVVIAHENITSQKLAEYSVRESEERYRTFLNSANDIAFIKNENLRYLLINKAGCNFLRKNTEEIVGKTDFDLLEHSVAHACSLSDKKSLEKNDIVVTIETIGKKVYESRKFPLKLKNGNVGVAGFIRDVTDFYLAQKTIQESEQKYRNLVENSLVGVYTTNTKGDFLFVNSALCKILEFDSPQDLIKTDVNSIYKNKADRNTFLEKLSKKNRLANYEIELITAKGNHIHTIVSAALTERTISGMILDITDRKRAEQEVMAKNYEIETQNEEYRTLNEELLIAKEKAEESDRLKTAFLQNLSHEIRTPMNGIMGFTHLLKEKMGDPEITSQYLDVIEKSGDRLMNLISDLVDISKIETGQITINEELFNVNELMSGLKGFFSGEASEKGLTISITKHLTEKYTTISSDKGKLFQVLSNLIKNAIKFTEEGTIEMGCELKDNVILFFVRDSGIGIHPDKINIIFERFIQADTSISRGYEGAGFGLSISKAFIEALGGQIWAESELGKGSTFLFTLPYNSPESKNELYNDMEKGTSYTGETLKVLVAEDDVVSRMLLSEILRDCGMEVTFARNGQEAVDKIKSDPSFDLILMDLKMPIMNGYEATEKIREMGYNNPIIAQTAYASADDRSKVNESGFTAYLSKPINQKNLLEIIKAIRGI